MLEIGISGVSSSRAALTSWASVRSTRVVRASRISWYWRWLSRSCQGTHLMAPSGLNHWCTVERRRRLGMLSWSSSSPG